jgi:hypothetical protein
VSRLRDKVLTAISVVRRPSTAPANAHAYLLAQLVICLSPDSEITNYESQFEIIISDQQQLPRRQTRLPSVTTCFRVIEDGIGVGTPLSPALPLSLHLFPSHPNPSPSADRRVTVRGIKIKNKI